MIILFIVGISLLIQLSDAYVLLQVRKQDDNHSNIDALIHKVIPSVKFEKFARKMARKQFHEKAADVLKSEQTSIEDDVKQNGGLSLKLDETNSDRNLLKLIELGIKQFINEGGPVLRANNQEIKPKTIKFRTGESSVLYEVNSKSLIRGLEELLSSKMVGNYLDKLTRQAAVVYRSMKDSKF